MLDNELKEEVKAAIDAAAAEEPSTPAENEPSIPEVKEEVEKVDVVPNKLEEQVKNLNIALKQEREESKRKLGELSEELKKSSDFVARFQDVVNPKKQEEEPEAPSYATKDDIDLAVEAKLQAIKEEQLQNQKISEYKQEIKNLETEWNGEEGKPKYDDEEVLNWQRENERTYLTPRDAFYQMRHAEILDYEVKKRLSSANPAIEVEKPSSVPANHEEKSWADAAKINTRDAIRQAIDDADKEM